MKWIELIKKIKCNERIDCMIKFLSSLLDVMDCKDIITLLKNNKLFYEIMLTLLMLQSEIVAREYKDYRNVFTCLIPEFSKTNYTWVKIHALINIIKNLNERKIKPLFIKSIVSLPLDSDNYDIMIPSSYSILEALKIFNKKGYVHITSSKEPCKHLLRSTIEPYHLAPLHVHTKICWEGYEFVPTNVIEKLLEENTINDASFFIPKSSLAFAINVAHDIYENKLISLRSILSYIISRSKNDVHKTIEIATRNNWLDGINLFFEFINKQDVSTRIPAKIKIPLILKLWYKKISKDVSNRKVLLHRITSLSLRALKRRVKLPKVIIIVFSGPDKSGKTSHAIRLVRELKELDICKVNYLWYRGLGKVPHKFLINIKYNNNFIKKIVNNNMIKALIALMDHFIKINETILKNINYSIINKNKCLILVYDRYLFDTFIDNYLQRDTVISYQIYRVLSKLLPKAHMHFITLSKRSNPLELTTYLYLSLRLKDTIEPNIFKLTTDINFNKVHNIILSKILKIIYNII